MLIDWCVSFFIDCCKFCLFVCLFLWQLNQKTCKIDWKKGQGSVQSLFTSQPSNQSRELHLISTTTTTMKTMLHKKKSPDETGNCDSEYLCVWVCVRVCLCVEEHSHCSQNSLFKLANQEPPPTTTSLRPCVSCCDWLIPSGQPLWLVRAWRP